MTGNYHPGIVVLSVLMAVIASYAAWGLALRSAGAKGQAAHWWLVGGAFAMGVGIWSMHFVGMLAFHLPVRISYDFPLTLASMVAAMVCSWLALFVIRRETQDFRAYAGSGLLLGAGIAAMHYTGMAAMKMSPPISYDPTLCLLSILIAVVASMGALWMAFRLESAPSRAGMMGRRLGSAVLMGGAISGMHYTGLAAAIFAPGSVCLASPRGNDSIWLVLFVSIGSAAIFSITVLASAFDARLAEKANLMSDQQQRANAEIRESEERFRQITENINEIIYISEPDGRINYVSPAYERVMGRSCQSAYDDPKTVLRAIHPEDWPRVRARLPDRAKGDYDLESRIVRPDGSVRWIRDRAFPVRDPQAEVYRIVGIAEDVTERKRAEQALSEIKEGLAAAQRIAHIGSWDWNVQTDSVHWSDESFRIFGMTPGEQVNHQHVFAQLLHREDRKRVEQALADALTGIREYDIEYRIRLTDGTEKVIHSQGEVLKDAAGKTIGIRGINHDITERKRAEQALQESERQYRQLHESMMDGFLQVDMNGRITETNEAFRKIVGYEAEELKKLNRRDLTPRKWLTLTDEIFASQVLVRGYSEIYEKEYLRKDGTAVPVEVRSYLMRDGSGKPSGLWAVVRDITEKKRAAMDLQGAKEAAEAANRAKSDFLANMSHEIRTPMNGVVGMAELLLRTELTPEQREYAEGVLKSADSLLTIIDDILDFSKVEAGKLHLDPIEFVLRTAIEEVADLLADRAQSKGVELACLIHHDIPVVVRGDRGRLRQVMTNLLGNSVKFTKKGEVALRARLAEDWGEEVCVRFEITDTGIGISPQGRARLFQSFSQADTSTTRKFGGTGLGLAISKNLVELMGGQIGVESEEGKGSTFWFTVKLGKVAADRLAAPTPLNDLRGLYALVVDDNQTNLQILHAQALSWGMRCDLAPEGSAALAMICSASLQHPYDLALLDMQMPGMDGLELAQAIKSDPANAGLKLVLMTSMAQRGQVEQSHQAGFAGYLTKPVRQSQLYDCLRTVMGRSTQVSAEKPQPAPLVTVHSLQKARELRRPRVLLAEDNPTNQMAAIHMLEKLGYQVDVAANGIEAVRACREVDYGIVLMDNQMPEMDGLTAAREVRRFEQALGKLPVPIIALTANAMQGDREKCIAAGMNDYLPKPFKMAQLGEVLERWEKFSPPAAPPAAATAPALPESAIDSSLFDDFREAGGEGASDFVSRLIEKYLMESQSRVEDLKDAIKRLDAAALKHAAHSLKGSSRTVGANRLAVLCGEIEEQGRDSTLAGTAALMAQLSLEFDRVREALRIELRPR